MRPLIPSVVAAVCCLNSAVVMCQDGDGHDDVLTPAQAESVDAAVDRALQWLSTQQQPDGSFTAHRSQQPAVTCHAVLAFLSAGHSTEGGQVGKKLTRAIEFVLGTQQEDGFLCLMRTPPSFRYGTPAHTGYYNHAIAGLMLSEVSGQLQKPLSDKVVSAVNRALAYSKQTQQLGAPQRPIDAGGWRYPRNDPLEHWSADLSVTAWQVTFLRSSRNAGFDVDEEMVAAATKYVRAMYNEEQESFTYNGRRTSRGMAGAGIMSMAMLGQQEAPELEFAINWLQERPFTGYGRTKGVVDYFHYSVYYCTQAMYQLGGDAWKEYFPPVAEMMLSGQRPDGSWRAMQREAGFSDTYTTCMSILALTSNYGLLPIHQR